MAISADSISRQRPAVDRSSLEFPDNRLLVSLCGEFDRNLGRVEAEFGVQITRRGNHLDIIGDGEARGRAARVLRVLYERLEGGRPVGPMDIDATIRFETGRGNGETRTGRETRHGHFRRGHGSRNDDGGGVSSTEPWRPGESDDRQIEIRTRRKTVEPRTPTQAAYIRRLFRDDMVFGLGPAGTGKTYLAVAVAVSLYLSGEVDRIILSRPAVEAGERLGFLPGDMREKVDPYMQPLHAALNDFLPSKQLGRLIEDNLIEIAPLAFMRGRTLENAFAVLDEAQNATSMQMKMFLTRLGHGSRMAITGDTSQIDLPRGLRSGLVEATRLLKGIDGIGFIRFGSEDVVRHGLVRQIVDAYGAAESDTGPESEPRPDGTDGRD